MIANHKVKKKLLQLMALIDGATIEELLKDMNLQFSIKLLPALSEQKQTAKAAYSHNYRSKRDVKWKTHGNVWLKS